MKTYMWWPFLLTGIWALFTILTFIFCGARAGLLAMLFLAVDIVIVVSLFRRTGQRLLNDMISFATQYGQVQKALLKEFVLPYAILDSRGNFLWMNSEFASLSGKEKHYHKSVRSVFPSIKPEDLPGEAARTECEVSKDGRNYRAAMQKIPMKDMIDGQGMFEVGEIEYLIAMYLFDETELNELLDERDRNKVVFGVLCLDNYDEALEGVEDVRKSLLLALIERKINRYFKDVDGIVRKLENDKYFFLIRKRSLEELEKAKFSILDDVKTVNIGNEMSVTLSMGIGLGANSYLQNEEAARVAMELALGRGGDQVVVKDGYRTRFFGGKSESTEKFTRVKARVKAYAMKEIFASKEQVMIMGHKISDVDAIGAAVGIYRAAKTLEKPAYIVCDDAPDSGQMLINTFNDSQEFDDNMFITCKKARELTHADTALVVVDTNRAGYVECEELLHLTNTIIVLDHHRQGRDQIQNAVLSYIEPYASSACEMVAEVLQYFDEDLKLKSLEADALYSGIILDTQNFTTRTGVRTFEAAAYLRRCGADVVRVRKLFRDSMRDLQAKAQTVANAETFEGCFAISVCDATGVNAPTVVAAQAANNLLNVVGIKASFVLVEYNELVYISARSIDEVNVQVIMEHLGGGGHLGIAGAQLPDTTAEEAVKLLKATIKEMKTEGDI